MLLQPEVVHHRFHEAVLGRIGVHLLELCVAVAHGKLGVAQAHVKQLLLVPALGHEAFCTQHLHIDLGQHGAAGNVESVPNLGNGRGEDFFV